MDRSDYISQDNLARSLKRTRQTVNIYLARDDFIHITRFTIGHKVYFKNFTTEDILKLKEYINASPQRRKKK